jgi:hypothetical protein
LRTRAIYSTAIVAAALLLAAGTLVLAALNEHGSLVEKLSALAVTALPYPIVGALIAHRLPRNAVGWVLVAIGLLQGVQLFTDEYAYRSFVTEAGPLPFGPEVAWLSFWTWMPSLALLVTLTLLLFPDGRPPSPKWRWGVWFAATGVGLIVLIPAVAAWPYRGRGLEATGHVEGVAEDGFLAFALVAAGVIILLSAIASVASVIVRFRTSSGVERQQLKWFTYAGGFAFAVTASAFLPLPRAEWFEVAFELLFGFGLLIVPIAIGIAILKHRLYEIDRIINRTLVYGAVTGSLALVYATFVFAFGAILGTFGSGNNLVVAGATLTVAAMFRPLRRRVQDFIDRRFNRSRYDAARTVDAFGTRLRHQTDLQLLTDDLLAIVHQTMQPASVSLWLRRAAR